MHLPTVLVSLAVILLASHPIESFQPISRAAQTPSRHFDLAKSTEQQSFGSSALSLTEMNLKKKKAPAEEPVREKNSPAELVLLYMTPWRNPNSLFVYLFGAVWLLGKYSEAQLAAGNLP